MAFEGLGPEQFDRLGRDRRTLSLRDVDYFSALMPDSVQTPRQILRWTMNEVATVGNPGQLESAREAHRRAQNGGGLVCGQMSGIFEHALAARGHTSRRLQLARSLFASADTHVTVEVLVDGRWVIHDPTFNVMFRKDGGLLGAADLRESLLQGTRESIEPVFQGSVAYPARLEDYYMDWLPLYNNVLIFSEGDGSIVGSIPPLRYWRGPRWYYLRHEGQQPLWLAATGRAFYFLFVALLPIALLLLSLAVIGLLVARLRSRSEPPHALPHPQ